MSEIVEPEPAPPSPAPPAPAGGRRWWPSMPAALRRADWRYGLREYAIVVAGVLTAFALSAWWEGRQDHAAEREYLRQLLADTRENETRLAGAVEEDSLAGVALGRLTAMLYAPAPPAPDTLLDRFGGRAFSSSDVQLLAGTLGALIDGGDLRLIRTDSLRTLLVAYDALLAHEADMLRLFLQQSIGDPARIGRSFPFLRALIFGGGPEAARARVDVARLRGDPEAEAAFLAIQIANRNRVIHLGRLREATRRLRRALEAEPGLRNADA